MNEQHNQKHQKQQLEVQQDFAEPFQLMELEDEWNGIGRTSATNKNEYHER